VTKRFGLLAFSFALLAGACAADLPDYDPNCDDGQCDRASTRRSHATKIRDTAAQSGITNAVLLAGIGQVETNLAHCWSEATWACKGPASASCGGGPVIAGSADGACSLKRGGLGMFQFDGGTHNQTIAQYGADIVTLEGNVSEIVPFLVQRAIESVSGVSTEKEAIDWINSIRVIDGDPEFEKWLAFVTWRFNGCQGCTAQANKYRNGTHILQDELGAEFWGSIGEGGGGGLEEGNNETFVGTDCSADAAVCDFSFDGVNSQCVDWFDADQGALHGFCSVACEGTCPDKAGEAPTYCADFRNDPGVCASVPAAVNDGCNDMPGTILQVVPRFVGNSGAAQGWKGVCAPPGNGTECETNEGLGGECFDTDSMTCGGTLHTGLCPGGSNIKCCTR
jgi:hypothetical protein